MKRSKSCYAGCAASAPLAFVACYRVNCKMPEYAQIDLSASVENLDTFAIIPCGYPEAVHDQQDRFDEQRVHYVL